MNRLRIRAGSTSRPTSALSGTRAAAASSAASEIEARLCVTSCGQSAHLGPGNRQRHSFPGIEPHDRLPEGRARIGDHAHQADRPRPSVLSSAYLTATTSGIVTSVRFAASLTSR
jgi:hypothetical protein